MNKFFSVLPKPAQIVLTRLRSFVTLKRVILLFCAIIFLFIVTFALWVKRAPDVTKLKRSTPGITLKLKDAQGNPRSIEVGTKNPSWTPIDNIAPILITAIIQSEDISFYSHNGFDFAEIWDAIKTDLEEMSYVRGASTITMQLAKNLYLTREKSLTRKIKEAYLVVQIEKHLSKKRIMELYLNVVEWGPGIYGVKEASQYYFGKSPAELTVNEAAMLAVILPNPVYYNPYKRPEYAEKHKKRVLERMLKRGYITKDAYDTALNSPLALKNVERGKSEAEAWENISGDDAPDDSSSQATPEIEPTQEESATPDANTATQPPQPDKANTTPPTGP